MSDTTRTLATRTGTRQSPHAVGRGIWSRADGAWCIVVEVHRSRRDDGMWIHPITARFATPEEAAPLARAREIRELEQELRALGCGPDDERAREQHDARLAEVRGRLAELRR